MAQYIHLRKRTAEFTKDKLPFCHAGVGEIARKEVHVFLVKGPAYLRRRSLWSRTLSKPAVAARGTTQIDWCEPKQQRRMPCSRND